MPSQISSAYARSWLLVSGLQPEKFTQANESSADAIILDIEDGVPPEKKNSARADIVSWLETNDAWVRINDVTTDFWDDDLTALAKISGLRGVVLSKVEAAEQVSATANRLPGIPIIALVESALGIHKVNEIAHAPNVLRLAFGSGDFRRDTGMGDSPVALAFPRTQLVLASRVAKIAPPIDGPSLADDPVRLIEQAQHTAEMGMTGKLCMSADRASYANAALSPSSADIDWAHNMITRVGEDGSGVRDGSELPKLAKAKKIRELAQIYQLS